MTTERRCAAGIVAVNLGIVGAVQHVKSIAGDSDCALAPDDVLAGVDFNDLHVVLVTDEGVAVLETDAAGRERRRDTARPGIRVIGPDRVAAEVYFDDAVVVG